MRLFAKCTTPGSGSSGGGSDLQHFHEMRLARHRTAGGGRDENVVAMSAAEARQRREHEPLPPAAPDDAEPLPKAELIEALVKEGVATEDAAVSRWHRLDPAVVRRAASRLLADLP